MTALMGLATRLKLARLVVTVPDAPDTVAGLARSCFAGGADAVVLVEDLREALSDDTAVAGLDAIRAAAAMRGLTGYLGRPVRGAQLAPDLLVLADDEADAARTRRLVGPHTLLGRRCNAAAEVEAALADEAVDVLFVGPGLEHIEHAARLAPAHDPASKPWFAQGGITQRTLETVLRAGARRIVVERAVVEADDPQASTTALADALRAAWADDPRMEAITASAFGGSEPLTFRTGIVPGPSDLTL